MPMQTYRQLALEIGAALAQKQFASPEAEARIIAESVGGGRFFDLALREVPAAAAEKAAQILARRLKQEPLQYITGCAPFRELELIVTPDVLIPRPETELLVDFCIGHLPPNGTLLDLGTGSGAIALSVAFERCDSRVTAVDISNAALAVARKNAQKYQLTSRVEWLNSDLFAAVQNRRFDVVAANLPYVTLDEYSTLEREVRDFEPQLALTSGSDGLQHIRRAIAGLNDHLAPGGAAIFELSPPQAETVARWLTEAGLKSEIQYDLVQRPRFVAATKR